jgi:YHS domain-containing protein
MKKVSYIIALILAVTAVLSASGCAEKAHVIGNEIQGASEQVTPAETPAAMISTDSTSSKVVDVICKMKVEKSVIDTSVYKGKTYYFCSPYCKNEFDKNPEKFLNSQNNT